MAGKKKSKKSKLPVAGILEPIPRNHFTDLYFTSYRLPVALAQKIDRIAQRESKNYEINFSFSAAVTRLLERAVAAWIEEGGSINGLKSSIEASTGARAPKKVDEEKPAKKDKKKAGKKSKVAAAAADEKPAKKSKKKANKKGKKKTKKVVEVIEEEI